MITRREFDRLTDDQKFGFLYASAVAADHAGRALAAMMEDYQKRLEAIEKERLGTSG